MDPKIKEIESRLVSIWDRKKEIESAYHDVRVQIGEIPNTIQEIIAFKIASLNNVKDAGQTFSLILDQINNETENLLNDIWKPFAQAINNCHVCCPVSPFEISSFSELYNDRCLNLKQRAVGVLPNLLSLLINNQDSQSPQGKHAILLIADQCATFFNPIYGHLYSLTNKFYEEAIHNLDRDRTYFSSCLSKIRETFVSYQPKHKLMKEDCTPLKSDSHQQKNEKNNNSAISLGIFGAGVAACGGAIGALAGGVIGALIGGNFWRVGKLGIESTKDVEENNIQNNKDKNREDEKLFDKADSAVYAPAEAVKGDDILIQVYIYLPSEVSFVSTLASQVDPDATRRNYIPLTQLLKQGDKIKISLKSYGGEVLEEPLYETQWNRSLIKHEFVVSIPDDFHKSSLLNSIIILVNDVPVGEMKFKIRIVDSCPRTLWSEVHSKKYKKSFISYSHDDVERIRFLAEGFKIQGVDYFFDEHSLRTGDNYPKEIDQYISDCDVFVLCWSENAKKSSWVIRESNLALKRYQNDDNSIRIYPLSIIPKADLPPSLSDKFHFGQIE